MATVRANVIGLAKLQRSLRKIVIASRSGVQRAIAISAAEVQGDAQRSIQRGSRSGAIVTIGGKRHQRSAPGEPPKTDTGRLAAIADLRAVMAAWPDLPEAVEAGILAMVKASDVDKN